MQQVTTTTSTLHNYTKGYRLLRSQDHETLLRVVDGLLINKPNQDVSFATLYVLSDGVYFYINRRTGEYKGLVQLENSDKASTTKPVKSLTDVYNNVGTVKHLSVDLSTPAKLLQLGNDYVFTPGIAPNLTYGESQISAKTVVLVGNDYDTKTANLADVINKVTNNSTLSQTDLPELPGLSPNVFMANQYAVYVAVPIVFAIVVFALYKILF